MRISIWVDDLIMHSISSQWLWKIEPTFVLGSHVGVILKLTSFKASIRREKSLSLSFSTFSHSELKKPIGNSSLLIVEIRLIRNTPSSIFKNLQLLGSSRSWNVTSKLWPLLRQCNWCFTIYRLILSKFSDILTIIWIKRMYKMIGRALGFQRLWLRIYLSY